MLKKIFYFFVIIFIITIYVIGFNDEAFNKKSELLKYNNNYVSLWGYVCEEESNSISSQKLTFRVRALKAGDKEVRLVEKILLNLKLYPQYHYGDFLFVRGRIVKPKRFLDFSYDRYLARYNIYSLMYYPRIEKSSGGLNFKETFFVSLLKFKNNLKEKIDKNLPEPSAGIASAILLGYKKAVAKEEVALFSRVGLSHMIAISGAHITIISVLIMGVFIALGLKKKGAVIFVFFF